LRCNDGSRYQITHLASMTSFIGDEVTQPTPPGVDNALPHLICNRGVGDDLINLFWLETNKALFKLDRFGNRRGGFRFSERGFFGLSEQSLPTIRKLETDPLRLCPGLRTPSLLGLRTIQVCAISILPNLLIRPSTDGSKHGEIYGGWMMECSTWGSG
jgi:hypothetical protein